LSQTHVVRGRVLADVRRLLSIDIYLVDGEDRVSNVNSWGRA
jgi:hypothetical protein